MSTVPNPAQERAYPIPAPADDRRFTLGLVFAVVQVLVDHGFPPVTSGGDLVALQQSLYGFIYRPADLGDDFDRSQTADADTTPPPATGRRYPPHFESGVDEGQVGETEMQCPPECAQNWVRASDPLVHVSHCPKSAAEVVAAIADTERPECGAWCADGPSGLCVKDRGHDGPHGDREPAAAQIRCSCDDVPDPDCQVHASRFRRLCDNPAPHGKHRWKSPAAVGAATWTCPGVPAWGGLR